MSVLKNVVEEGFFEDLSPAPENWWDDSCEIYTAISKDTGEKSIMIIGADEIVFIGLNGIISFSQKVQHQWIDNCFKISKVTDKTSVMFWK